MQTFQKEIEIPESLTLISCLCLSQGVQANIPKESVWGQITKFVSSVLVNAMAELLKLRWSKPVQSHILYKVMSSDAWDT